MRHLLRKPSARRLSRRLLLLLMLAATSATHLFAQQEDSLRVRPDTLRTRLYHPGPAVAFDSLSTVNSELPALRRLPVDAPSSSRRLPVMPALPYHVNPSLLHKGDYSTGGAMWLLEPGYIVGRGEQRSVPGIGRFNAAALGWQGRLNDRLTLQVMADAVKMNTARFTGQSFGLSAQMVYKAQDRLYFRTFGGVGFGDFTARPDYGFGGTVGMGFTDRFGVEVGAQTFYNSLTGRWETLPIVAPYYKFNKFKLQMDFGPILFELIRGAIQKHRGGGGGSGGPTIMPDVPGFHGFGPK